VVLNAHALTVVGIADARYGALDRADFYLPLVLQPVVMVRDDVHDPTQGWLNMGARLRPGVTLSQAQAEIDVLSMDLRRIRPPESPDWHTHVYQSGGSSDTERRGAYAAIFAIILTVSMILLSACSNLANLLLARAAVRSREIGVRLSLGASRGRLVCQLLTESMLLAAAGGALGLLFSHWLAIWLAHLVPNVPNGAVLDSHPDPLVMIYAMAVSLAAGLSFGLAPALAATRTSLAQALHAEGLSGAMGPRRIWSPRNLLVIVPLAVSLMLLMSAGLTVRYVERIYTSRPSFATSNLIGIWLRLNSQGYDEARTRQFQQDLRERIGKIPGVTSVALAGGIPYVMGGARLLASGSTVSARVGYNVVTSDFLGTLGAPMERGRAFTTSDREGAPPVAIVNRFLARRYWPNEEAVGKRIRMAAPGSTWFDVIGVAQDLEDPTDLAYPVEPVVYIPYGQGSLFLKGTQTKTPHYQMQFLSRTDGRFLSSAASAAVKSALRQEVLAADPSLRVNIQSLDGLLESRIGPMKTISMLLSALGALALLMASVGIYAILAYAVSLRTREIGIRMALGAHRQQIVRLVMQRTVMLIAWGIGLGFVGAVAMSRILSSALAHFARLDGLTCISVALLLGLVALVASYLPARKALRVDPMKALRWE
jgi:predicted permease